MLHALMMVGFMFIGEPQDGCLRGMHDSPRCERFGQYAAGPANTPLPTSTSTPTATPTPTTASGSRFVVNSTGDGADFSAGDGTCETASGNGVCTLRAAIEEVNALGPNKKIEFAITPLDGSLKTISPATSLPAISQDGTTIEGYTQNGAALNTSASGAWNGAIKVEIAGGGGPTSALHVSADNVKVHGVAFTAWPSFAVWVDGQGGTPDAAEVAGNFFGTNDGSTVSANAIGVLVKQSGATNAAIGGSTPAMRNVAIGNTDWGIEIDDDVGAGNDATHNLAGFKVDGTTAACNRGGGGDIRKGGGPIAGTNQVCQFCCGSDGALDFGGGPVTCIDNTIAAPIGSLAECSTVAGGALAGHITGWAPAWCSTPGNPVGTTCP